MRQLAAIALRSLAWRRWASLSIVVTAVVAVAAASLGPLWANAAEDSLVSEELAGASPAVRTVSVASAANTLVFGESLIPDRALAAAEVASTLPAPVAEHVVSSTSALASAQRLGVRVGESLGLGQLLWVEDGCERLALARGRCPQAETEVAISARSAAVLGAELGGRLTLPELGREPPLAGTGADFPTRFRVVGVYRPAAARDGFWAGSQAFDFSPEVTSASSPRPGRLDALFAARSLLSRLAITPVTARRTQLIEVQTANVNEIDEVETSLAAWAGDPAYSRWDADVVVDAPLVPLLAGLHPVRDAIRLASYLLGLQLLMLVCYVLFLIVSSSAEARSHDVALAKLRGLPRRTVGLLALAEPVLLLVLAVPVGVGLGFVLTAEIANALLPGSVSVRPDARLGVAVLVAFAAAWAAASLGLFQLMRRTVLDQLRRVVPGSSPRRLLGAEVMVITLAATALYELSSEPRGAELAGLTLLAPGLAAIAVGVLAGRALRLAALPWARWTRWRPGVPGFLASRHIARRDTGIRTAVLVTVAISLATFAAATWSIAGEQRSARAAMEVGAPTVYTVGTRSAADLLRTVRDLDPAGTRLAAAVELAPEEMPPEQWVVAVDSTRLATVATWRDAWSPQPVRRLAAALRPDIADSVEFAGSRLSVQLDGSLASRSPNVTVTAGVSLADGTARRIPLGRLGFGQQTLVGRADVCADGCTLTDVTLIREPGEIGALIGSVTFAALLVDDVPVEPVFTEAADWRSTRIDEARIDSSPIATVSADAAGLRMDFNATPSGVPGIVRADVPEALPVLAVGATPADEIGRDDLVLARAISGVTTLAKVESRPVALPRLGLIGTMADLEFAYRLTPEIDPRATFQVWASDAAGSGVAAELRGAGLDVLGRESVADRDRALSRSGAALALLLLVLVAVGALAIAALSVLAFALVQARRRSYELAALRTVGVRDRALRAASMRENGVLIGFGVLVGLVTGAWTAWLLGPEVGVLGQTGDLAPVATGIPWVSLAVTATVSLVVFGLLAWLCARLSLRFADPEILRGAQT